MSRAVYDMLFSANLRKGVGGQIGKRNNKPDFVALRQAPARWHYSAHGGYPEKACKRRSLGHRDRIRRAMGDMTDFDRILPRLFQKVKR